MALPSTTKPIVWAQFQNPSNDDNNIFSTGDNQGFCWYPAVLMNTINNNNDDSSPTFYEVAFVSDFLNNIDDDQNNNNPTPSTTHRVNAIEIIESFYDERLQESFETSEQLDKLLSLFRCCSTNDDDVVLLQNQTRCFSF